MRPITIKVPVYRHTVIVVGTEAQFFKECEKAQIDVHAPEGSYAGLCITTFSTSIVGCFDKSVSTLVHELSHAALNICKARNIDPVQAEGEPFAYLLEYLFDEATKTSRS